MKAVTPFLRSAGSLWLAALLLLALMVAMGCATVYEAMHGTSAAKEVFYDSTWFAGLMILLGLNLLASVASRWPFTWRHVGFLLTHLAIVLIFTGAWVTNRFAVEGQIGLMDGQTAKHFQIDEPELRLEHEGGGGRAAVELDEEGPANATLLLDEIRVTIEAAAPDSTEVHEMVDDHPQGQPAVEIELDMVGNLQTGWLFAGQRTGGGMVQLAYRVASDAQALGRLTTTRPATQPASRGTVHIDVDGKPHQFSVEQLTDQALPLGDSGYTARLLRYMPHAMVAENRQLRNVSSRPVNPAVELELTGPNGTFIRRAFSLVPDFQSMHGGEQENVRVTLVTPQDTAPMAPIEFIGGPDGALFARFSPDHEEMTVQPVSIGTFLATPWPEVRIRVLRRFERANFETTVEPRETPGEEPTPALRLKVEAPETSETFWLQKHASRSLRAQGERYRLAYGDARVDLGFKVTLDEFEIPRYPGTMRPRSFRSTVSFLDPMSGRETKHVISMNHPARHGPYTFFQSSYREVGEGRMATFLSVSWDPGQPLVFLGYIIMMVGMVWVVGLRLYDRRRRSPAGAVPPVQIGGGIRS